MGSLLFNNTSRGHLRNIMRIIERSDVDLLRFPTFLMSKKISMSSMKDTVTCQEPLSQAPPSPKPVAHIPVMAREVLEYLAPRDNAVILDTTFGAGGHSRKILESCPGVRLMCLDRDPVAYKYAEELQREYPNRVFPLLGKFRDPNQLTAADILSHIDEDSLYKVLKYYGEESNARKISRVVVESRHLFRKLHTTKELAELVMSVTGAENPCQQ
ncbi:methyltransferase-like protein 15-like [Homarus americanus]|uniref:Methyltransferase-like protein 15-like n=1 Tax=Homarus americanus TaxID=6706 RepID=A0A8J5JXD8_HOMAM|nr:methyltransferase-like protein 15-like [Homarus americanus]